MKKKRLVKLFRKFARRSTRALWEVSVQHNALVDQVAQIVDEVNAFNQQVCANHIEMGKAVNEIAGRKIVTWERLYNAGNYPTEPGDGDA